MAEQSYEGIDFDAIQETCGLEKDEIKVLKICFGMFDVKHQDFLSADDLDDILRAMGFRPSKEELKERFEPLTKWLAEDALKEHILKAEMSERLESSPCALITSRYDFKFRFI